MIYSRFVVGIEMWSRSRDLHTANIVSEKKSLHIHLHGRSVWINNWLGDW